MFGMNEKKDENMNKNDKARITLFNLKVIGNHAVLMVTIKGDKILSSKILADKKTEQALKSNGQFNLKDFNITTATKLNEKLDEILLKAKKRVEKYI